MFLLSSVWFELFEPGLTPLMAKYPTFKKPSELDYPLLKKNTLISFPDDADGRLGFGVSGEHGPKPSEVYGFVGSITTVVSTDSVNLNLAHLFSLLAYVFLVWAYVPDIWLHSIGIYYYPSRYWALAVPCYVMVTIVLAVVFYIGLNFMATPPSTSLNVMFDEFSREPVSEITSGDDDELPIEPISDIGINQINDLMFKHLR